MRIKEKKHKIFRREKKKESFLNKSCSKWKLLTTIIKQRNFIKKSII